MLFSLQQGQLGRRRIGAAAGGGDPGYSFSLVELLLPFNNQTNGSDVYIDESSHVITVNFAGNVGISTAESAFAGTGEGSALFSSSGTNGRLTATLTNPFNRRTGLWCIETHVRMSSTNWCIVSANASGGSFSGTGFAFRSDGNVIVTDGTTTLTIRSGSTGFSLNTWAHLALTFDGTTYRYFVDGVLSGSSTTLLASGDMLEVRIGERPAVVGTDGYMDNFRITVGSAVYAAGGFTPPSAPHPES
jgi:hypothetical protein